MKHTAILPGLMKLETAAAYCGMTAPQFQKAVADVQGITDQSLNMIEHYAKKLNRRKMAGKAMLKWDVK